MHTALAVGLSAAFTVAVAFYFVRSLKRAPLDLALFLVADAGGRYLHLFGSRTVSPDDGASLTTQYHFLIDCETDAVIAGDTEVGDNCALHSPFVERSLERLAKKTGGPLALARKGSRFATGPGLAVRLEKNGEGEREAKRKRTLPNDALVVRSRHDPDRLDQASDRLDLELCRRGASAATWSLGGLTGFFFAAALPRDRLLFVYQRARMTQVGVGLAILDVAAGKVERDGFLRIETGR